MIRWTGAALAALALVLSPLKAADATVPVVVQCSPATVVLGACAIGDCMTVHAAIPLSVVDTTAPVTLNGLPAYLLKADNRGDLVAKFKLSELQALLAAPTTTLTLTGVTIDGVEFAGSDTVRVKE